MTHQSEPFESPPAPPPKRRSSALARSIAAANPALEHRTDAELITAHHRTLYLRQTSNLDQWAASQSPGKSRDDVYAGRLESLRTDTTRHATNDLAQVGMTRVKASEIADAIIADPHVYDAALASLSEELFR